MSSSTAPPSSDTTSTLIAAGQALLTAVQSAPIATISQLLKDGAPAWYQDEALGWSCLHYASERREAKLLGVLLRGGAVWNAVDEWGRTAGEICLSLGWEEGWEIIRNEGVRTEMLHHALKASGGDAEEDQEEGAEGVEEQSQTIDQENGTISLKAEDKTSAGDNLTFLKSRLTWDIGEDGKERVLDADGNGVMMGWEEPLMVEHVHRFVEGHPNAQLDGEGLCVLNVGYGLGIIDRLFQQTTPKPRKHVIIEAHPDVLAHMRNTGVYDWPGVHILEGRWQDFLSGEKIGELIEIAEGGFDAVLIDTFAEGYDDLKAFFEVLPDIIEPENGRFSFWNGLGATNATIYAVSCGLAELHLEDVGMNVEWHDVTIPESQRVETWKGVRRRYWDLPGYRLPLGKMSL